MVSAVFIISTLPRLTPLLDLLQQPPLAFLGSSAAKIALTAAPAGPRPVNLEYYPL